MSNSVNKNKPKEEPGFYIFATVCLLLITAFIIFSKTIGAFPIVAGSSMFPTLKNGDILYMSVSHHKDISEIQRGDIVVVEKDGGTLIIKRVIGLPGETIQMTNNKVYINGEDIHDEYDFNYGGVAENPIQLGEDEFFVCGDNRNNSEDSRVSGAYSYEKIRGIVKRTIIHK